MRRSFQSVFDRSEVMPESGCIIWAGYKNEKGYGVFSKKYAHRFSYEHHYKVTIPAGILVCHHCDTPSCVNPQHLFLGTQKDNIADMIKKGRARYADVNGKNNPMFGKHHSEETRKKLSIIKTGNYAGENHPRASITMDDVHSIRAKRSQGLTAKQISTDLGISFHIVRNVIYGKSWRY